MNANQDQNRSLGLSATGWIVLAPFIVIFGVFILFTFYFTLLPIISLVQLVRFFVDPKFRRSLVEGGRRSEGEHVYFHPGHTWARVEGPNVVVGLDEFASSLVGEAVKAVEPSGVGAKLKTGEKVWSLRFDGRCLEQTVPVGGEVVAVNRDILSNPALLARLPARDLWIVKMRPAQALADLRERLTFATFSEWNRTVRDRVLARFAPETGPVLADGGQWAPGLATRLTDDEWDDLVWREFR